LWSGGDGEVTLSVEDKASLVKGSGKGQFFRLTESLEMFGKETQLIEPKATSEATGK
jgi:hypothetical protein